MPPADVAPGLSVQIMTAGYEPARVAGDYTKAMMTIAPTTIRTSPATSMGNRLFPRSAPEAWSKLYAAGLWGLLVRDFLVRGSLMSDTVHSFQKPPIARAGLKQMPRATGTLQSAYPTMTTCCKTQLLCARAMFRQEDRISGRLEPYERRGVPYRQKTNLQTGTGGNYLSHGLGFKQGEGS